MLQISKRGQLMPPSPIRKLVPCAETAKKKGVRVYHLNIGQPDIETPKMVLDAVRNSDFKVLEYSHSAGNASATIAGKSWISKDSDPGLSTKIAVVFSVKSRAISAPARGL